MEMASVHASTMIRDLLNVVALTNMHRASDNDEYRASAEAWIPALEHQLSCLKRELLPAGRAALQGRD